MSDGTIARALLCAVFACAAARSAIAEDTIKIGLLVPFSGQFADIGEQMSRGAELYVRQHGDEVAGHKIIVLKRDANGMDPAQTKRLVQELITRDKVNFLAGFGLTPDAIAAAPLGTEAKVPMVIMNAATAFLTEKSPYFVRVSFTLAQLETPFGEWAAKNGMHKVYVAISDYAPGYEAGDAFKKSFTAAAGEIVGEVKIPVANLEFGAYVQRIKDANPQAVFLFMPSGQLPLNFVREFVQLGMMKSGVQLLGASEIIDDPVIESLGDQVLGVLSVQNYSYAHPGQRNRDFIAAYEAAFGSHPRANFLSVGGYDGMDAIYRVSTMLGGIIDPDKAMAAFKGLTLDSPRGPVKIDPATREPIESVFVRKVARLDGGIVNQEIAEFPRVRTPGQ